MPEPAAPATNMDEPALVPVFKPDLRFYGAFGSLLVVFLAAALDATSLSVALPVSSIYPILSDNRPTVTNVIFSYYYQCYTPLTLYNLY